MREIVLDTETTGFDPQRGDRIVEIGGVELHNHLATGKIYHQYINPQRDMPKEAFQVHGLSKELLSDKPEFAQIGQDFLDFVGDAKLVIHNASFDMRFLNAELGWMGLPLLPIDRAIDTLEMARRKFPGSPATLDALCRRFSIDTSARVVHGALLDSQILAEVYLQLLGGREPGLELSRGAGTDEGGAALKAPPRSNPLAPRITRAEKAAHARFVERLGKGALWSKTGM